MIEYIIEDNLTDPEMDFFKKLSQNISNVDTYLFCGHPLYEKNKGKYTIAGLLVNNKGVFLFFRDETDKKTASSYILSILSENEEISSLLINSTGDQRLIESFSLHERLEDVINRIEIKKSFLDEKSINLISQLLNHSNVVSTDLRALKKQNSLGGKIVMRSQVITNYDESQFNAIFKENSSNMRIRGLAGSGKTIVLVKKMAYLHFKNPDLKLCYVFYTKSLKQYIIELFRKYYSEFSPTIGPNMDKVTIVHCWGGKKIEGFYSIICRELDMECKTYQYGLSIEDLCKEVLEQTKDIENFNLFDYIFIDEGQDFRLSFYKLAVKSLVKTGFLTYAYDELQTLSATETKIPSPTQIFGDKRYTDSSLNTCYRTPKEIIVTAHMLGLGLYYKNEKNEKEPLNFVSNIEIWKAIGYKNRFGKIAYGQEVSLFREDVYKIDYDPICIKSFLDNDAQLNFVADEIVRLIEKEDILAEDILIIDMNSQTKDFSEFSQKIYKRLDAGKTDGFLRKFNVNLVDKDNALLFRIKGNISYTTVYRAKGNESNIVFLINCEQPTPIKRVQRSQLFTAMTRAKTKVYVLGLDEDMRPLVDEVSELKNNNYELKFLYPDKEKISLYKSKMLEEEKIENDINASINIANILKEDPDKMLKYLLQQTGVSNSKQLIEYIKKISGEKNEC